MTGVTLPLSIDDGDSWIRVTEFRFASSVLSDTTLTYEFHAVGTEAITVLAGKPGRK